MSPVCLSFQTLSLVSGLLTLADVAALDWFGELACRDEAALDWFGALGCRDETADALLPFWG
jgi:hypothetical protein